MDEQARYLDFYLNINARRQIEPHEHIDRLGIWIENIDQAVMSPNFKVLVRVFVDESRAAYCKPFNRGRLAYGAYHMGTKTFGGIDNPRGRLVEDTVVISLKAD